MQLSRAKKSSVPEFCMLHAATAKPAAENK